MHTYTFVSHLLYYYFEQIDLASTVQTVPQLTGFFSILGGFLVDMTFELSYLFWFFVSEVFFPGIYHFLRFVVLLIVYFLIVIASPILGDRGKSLRIKTTRRRVRDPHRSSPKKERRE